MGRRVTAAVIAAGTVLALASTHGAWADTSTLNVLEDSYTSQSNAGAVHGSINYLGVKLPPGSAEPT